MAIKKKIKRVLKVGREDSSGLSSFVERPVPSSGEVANFERVIGRELREQEIDSNLDEIYSDKKGERINIKKMKIKKRPLFLLQLFKYVFILTLLTLISYAAYFYLFSNSNDISSMNFEISSPSNVLAGESFSYQIKYHNPTKYSFRKLHLELQYPKNFIFDSASLPPSTGNATWDLADLSPGESKTLTINGSLIALPESANLIFGHLSYFPNGFTSQFKKDVSALTIVSGPGFAVNLDSSGTAFLNQNNDLSLIFSALKNNYLGDFNINFSLPDHTNASVVLDKDGDYSFLTDLAPVVSSSPSSSLKSNSATSSKMVITPKGGMSWQISGFYPPLGRQEIPIVYKVSKILSKVPITIQLEKNFNGQSYVFWQETIEPQLVKSDLNLTLSLNDSPNDNAVNFGQALKYSVSYSNQGSNTYKDVVIMAAVKSDFVNWNSIKVANQGQSKNKTVIWTKNEVPALANIKPGDSGSLDFTLDLSPFNVSDLGKDLSLTSYAQYSMNGQAINGDDNKSNTISSKINSNLLLKENIRYFDTNNLPVGAGPLPPRVGQKTSFRIYWLVTNSLHELSSAQVFLKLPAYVNWGNNSLTEVGSLHYDDASHQVVWDIDRIPISVSELKAFFDINIIPQISDRNKILVLSPGAKISAMDDETTAMISKKTLPKTTKLEDDNIASLNNSGIVQ